MRNNRVARYCFACRFDVKPLALFYTEGGMIVEMCLDCAGAGNAKPVGKV